MDGIAKVLLGVLIVGDFLWRVARVVSGEPIVAAARTTPRLQLVVVLALGAAIFGLGTIEARGVPGKISWGVLCAATTVTLILALIFGGVEETSVDRHTSPTDPPGDSK